MQQPKQDGMKPATGASAATATAPSAAPAGGVAQALAAPQAAPKSRILGEPWAPASDMHKQHCCCSLLSTWQQHCSSDAAVHESTSAGLMLLCLAQCRATQAPSHTLQQWEAFARHWPVLQVRQALGGGECQNISSDCLEAMFVLQGPSERSGCRRVTGRPSDAVMSTCNCNRCP